MTGTPGTPTDADLACRECGASAAEPCIPLDVDLSKLAGEVAAGFAGYRRQDGGVTWVACLGDRPDEIVMARVAHGAVEYRTIRVHLEER